MSTDEDTKKSGLIYVLLIGILIVVVVSLFTVPFAALGLAIKKSGVLGQQIALQAAASENSGKDTSQDSEFAGLRATAEQVAASLIKDPNLKTITEFIKIESPSAKMEQTKSTVSEVLTKGNHQFVEAIDRDQIKIIVILKSKDWPTIAEQLMNAADTQGFVYRGPKSTATAGEADTVVAEIEIARKK